MSVTDHSKYPNDIIIAETQTWIETVIIGLNFCPFAKREYDRGSICYSICRDTHIEDCLHKLIDECVELDSKPEIETTLLIFPDSFNDFDDYLDYVDLARALLDDQGYTGIYQIATFHPDYCFEDSADTDPANYTNRSPYPMLHIIRETSLERALHNYPQPENIPKHNIELARRQGQAKMQALLDACYKHKT